MEGIEPAFVGLGRHALVEGLLACFDQVGELGRPLWVHLEAPSGWGKTRVVREFYARLAAERQPEPTYWPPTILGSWSGELHDDVGARRKRVHPAVRHQPGALPAFFWWGLTASMRHGVPSLALMEDLGQLEAHAPYLDDAWRRLATYAEKHGRWWLDRAGEAAREGATELAGNAVEAIAGVAVPGLGLIVALVGEVNQLRQDAQLRAQRAESNDAIDSSRHALDLVERTVLTLTRLARRGLPVVVFVEDVHAADEQLAGLLQRLVAADSAILIVTSSWPGFDQQNGALSRAMSQEPGRLLRIGAAPSPPPFAPTATLGPLAGADLAAIVRFYYPQVAEPTLARLVERYPNPLLLELFCMLPRYRQRFPGGDLQLGERELERLPRSLEDLYRELWAALPAPVRKGLTLAAFGVPAAINQAATDPTWNLPLLLSAMQTLDLHTEQVADALANAPQTAAWSRVLTGALRQFHEPDQLSIAREDDEFFLEADRADFLVALADQLRRPVEHGGIEERVHAANMALALGAEGELETAVLVRLADRAAADLAQLPRELERLIRLAESVLELDPEDTPDLRALIWKYARALYENGRAETALGVLASLHRRYLESDGPGSAAAASVRHEMARCHRSLGRVSEAIAIFEELLAERRSRLGPSHPSTLTTASNLAEAQLEAGRADLAVEQCAQLLPLFTQCFGAASEHTLLVRNNLASALAASGRLAEAIEARRDLLAAQASALGMDSVSTLNNAHNLVHDLVDRGDLQVALLLNHDVVAHMREALGKTHPRTLTSRNSLAFNLAAAGRTQAAIEAFEELLADAEPVFDAFHPWRVNARDNLARTLAAAGRAGDAVGEFRKVLELRQHILAPDDPELAHTRHNLALCLDADGRPAEALEQYRATLTGYRLALGPDHEDSVALGIKLATRLGQDGAAAEAADLIEAAITSIRTWPSPDPRYLLVLAGALGRWLCEAGRAPVAAARASSLLGELEGGFHPDDTDLLILRWSLGRAWLLQGETRPAIRLLEEVVSGFERTLGAEHPNSLAARSDLEQARTGA